MVIMMMMMTTATMTIATDREQQLFCSRHLANSQQRAHGPAAFASYMYSFFVRFSGLIVPPKHVVSKRMLSLCMLSSRTVWLHPMRRRRRLETWVRW